MSGATLFMLVLLLLLLALLLGRWAGGGGPGRYGDPQLLRGGPADGARAGLAGPLRSAVAADARQRDRGRAVVRHLAPAAGGASGLVRPLVVGRRGAILLVPESVFLPDEGLRRQSGAWLRLLRLFLRLRGRRALDGVVWNIPLARLQDGEQAANLGLAARRRYVELTQRLGLSLPVYVVITGLEDLPGFQELRGAARGGARARPRLVLAVRRRSGLAVALVRAGAGGNHRHPDRVDRRTRYLARPGGQ